MELHKKIIIFSIIILFSLSFFIQPIQSKTINKWNFNITSLTWKYSSWEVPDSLSINPYYDTDESPTIILTGNESMWVENVTFEGNNITVIAKKEKDRTYEECIEWEDTSCKTKKNVTYHVPDSMPIKDKDGKLKEVIIKIYNNETKKDKFKYEDKDKDKYLKIGNKSIVIISNVASKGILENVTVENRFVHLNVSDPNLIFYMPFDDNISTTAVYDYSGNQDGTLSRGAKSTSDGAYSNGVILDGTNDYILMSNNPIYDFSNDSFFTLSAWVNSKAPVMTVRQGILSRNAGTGHDGYVLDIRDGNFSFWVKQGSVIVSAPFVVVKDTWYHVLVTYNASNDTDPVKMYVDGNIQASGTVNPGEFNRSANVLNIGRDVAGLLPFNGIIDEVMIYNKTLSATEVLATYNNQSSRFFPTGTQTFNNTNVSGTGLEDRLNISITNCSTLVNSKIGFSVNNGRIFNLTNCAYNDYQFRGNPDSINATFFLYTNSYGFYSPIMIDNITLTSYTRTENCSAYVKNISTCGILSCHDTTYVLNQSIAHTSGTNCFTIMGQNITLDFNGFNVTEDIPMDTAIDTSSGTFDYDDLTVKNGIIENFGIGMSIFGNRANVTNMTFSKNGMGILSFNPVVIEGSSITNNRIIGIDGNSIGMLIQNTNNSVISNNVLSTGTTGLHLNSTSSNNTLNNNTISDYEILLHVTGNYNIVSNSTLYNGTSGVAGSSHFQLYGNYNRITNLLINLTNKNAIELGSGGNNLIDDLTILNENVSYASIYHVKISGVSSNNTLLNASYLSENISTDASLIRKWYLDLNVTNLGGTAIENANVTGYNITEDLVFTELTNTSGYITQQILTEYINNGTAKYYATPHTINTTSYGSFPNSTITNLSVYDVNDRGNKILTIILGGYYPYFTTIPNNASITYGDNWEGVYFNATDDFEFDSYKINNTKFTINSTGYLNWTGQLSADNYYVLVTINNTIGNENSTIYNLNITKKVPVGSVSGTSPITYGNAGDVEGTESNTGDGDVVYNLYRNGTVVSNPDTTILKAETYGYVYNTTGGENYTSNSSMGVFTLVVDKANVGCGVLFNETSPLVYPNSFLVWHNCSTTATLYRNGTIISNNSQQNLGAGYYNFTAIVSDGENYTNTYAEENFEITKATGLVYTHVNELRENITYEKNEFIWVNGTLIEGYGNITLYRDGVEIDSGTSPLASYEKITGAIGYKINFTIIYLGNENYTASSETWFVEVVTSDTDPPHYHNETVNIASPTTYSITALYNFSIIWHDNTAVDYVIFSFNGTNYTYQDGGGDVFVNYTFYLPAGSYDYYWWANDTKENINYTTPKTYVVDKFPTICDLSGSSDVTYPNSVGITGSCNNLEASGKVYLNNSLVNLPFSQVLGADYYEFYLNVTETQNYTFGSDLYYVTVSKGTPSLNIINNNSGWRFTENKTLEITGVETNIGDGDIVYELYLDDVNKTNPFIETFTFGNYTIKFNSTEGVNWTSGSFQRTLLVKEIVFGECGYKKYGYYNDELPFMKGGGCV